MALSFSAFFANLEAIGAYGYLFPWILFLMIFYLLLKQLEFIKKDEQKGDKIAIVISAILSFFVVNYTPFGMSIGSFLTDLFGTSAVYLVGVLVVLLFLGLGGFDLSAITGNKNHLAIVLLVLAILVVSSVGIPGLVITEDMWTLLILLIIFGGAILFLGEGKKEEQ